MTAADVLEEILANEDSGDDDLFDDSGDENAEPENGFSMHSDITVHNVQGIQGDPESENDMNNDIDNDSVGLGLHSEHEMTDDAQPGPSGEQARVVAGSPRGRAIARDPAVGGRGKIGHWFLGSKRV